MNNRFLTTLLLTASSVMFVTGCSNDSPFETPNASGETPENTGTVSQKNFSILADDTQPEIYDENGVATDTELTITVKVGDNSNTLLTDEHTVHFMTEWGLIDNSCKTSNGTCSVKWQTSFAPDPAGISSSNAPADHKVTITAYTLGAEEFSDVNGDGVFDDNDTIPLPGTANLFIDRPEPFVDADRNGVFNTGDTIIDVIDGNELGSNGVNDPTGDGFLNSPTCRHSSLCNNNTPLIYVWDDIQINMDGPPDTTTTP